MSVHTTYNTSDIVLAATLKCHGYVMTSITINGNKGTFVFADVPNAFLMEYELGAVRVEPMTFNNSIKQLTTSVKRMCS